ncbi:MAG TPA: hypothetical protein GYA06_01350 [Chloroflexi bacterium]|nr:hypothetical protein [Chloroflexota bacterium]HPO57318.1 GyrI-like domain-containing protein [Anaerolineaceae bacterium]
MITYDFKKELKHLYQAAASPALVDVPPMNFLKIDGQGDPNTSEIYQSAVNALYGLSYAIKFLIKKRNEVNYSVFPLEGLWWAEVYNVFLAGDKDKWSWTMMIAQPEWVDKNVFAEALEETRRKKPSDALERVRFEEYAEGRSAQVMHIGPYSEERPTIERLHRFIEEQGLALGGLHHEIYLGDPRRTAPEKLKTILRQPVRPA